MSYTILGGIAFALLMVCIVLHHFYTEDKKKIEGLERAGKNREELIYDLQEERENISAQFNIAYRQAIYNAVVYAQNQNELYRCCSASTLTDLILEHKSCLHKYLDDIRNVNDKTIDKIIKISVCAEADLINGFQTIYGSLFRKNVRGDEIELTESEVQMLNNEDYDFILDEISIEEFEELFQLMLSGR